MKLSIPKLKGKSGKLIELVVIVTLTVATAFTIQAWIVKPYQIPTRSMMPTLEVGQRVLVNRFLYHFTDPSAGDIVVFHPPAQAESEHKCGVTVSGRQPYKVRQACPEPDLEKSEETFTKRIVAGPGDTLSVRDGHPVVNGEWKREESYTLPCGSASICNLPRETGPLLHDG